MRRLLLIGLLSTLYCSSTSFANGTKPSDGVQEAKLPLSEGILSRQIGVHLTPSGLLGTFRGIRFGGQIRRGRFIVGGDVVLGSQSTANLVLNNNQLLGYEATGFYPEIKYIIAEAGENECLYLSAVVPIRKREAIISGGTYVDFNRNVRYDVGRVKQDHRKVSVGVKLDAIKALGTRFYWEYYAGFGVGHRTTDYTGTMGRNPDTVQPGEERHIKGDLLSARQCYQADLLLGIRVGFRL